jgi:hypothetical protein
MITNSDELNSKFLVSEFETRAITQTEIDLRDTHELLRRIHLDLTNIFPELYDKWYYGQISPECMQVTSKLLNTLEKYLKIPPKTVADMIARGCSPK